MFEIASLADLLDLQALDSDIDRLLEQRQSLPELDEYRAADVESKRQGAALESVETQLRETELAVDKADGELQIMEEKIHQTERRLFAGGMSARETENMRLEVEQLHRQGSELETAVLEGLERRDRLREDREQAEEVAREWATRKGDLEEVIAAAWRKIDAELATREARKAELVPSIDAELLSLYEQLLSLKEGVAVAPLTSRVCGGCHLKLSAAELEEALASEPPRCTHCRRILVP